MGIIRTVLRIGNSGMERSQSPCMKDCGHWSWKSEKDQLKNTIIQEQTEGQDNLSLSVK